ncbi:MAG: hypothetical protein ACOX7P_05620 [Oscillospiraceae bacterium]|jgi:hypothetical protein
MSKKTTVTVLLALLLLTGILWLLTGRNTTVVLLGLAAIIACVVADTLLGLRKETPGKLRARIQAVLCCAGGGALFVFIIIYVIRGV